MKRNFDNFLVIFNSKNIKEYIIINSYKNHTLRYFNEKFNKPCRIPYEQFKIKYL